MSILDMTLNNLMVRLAPDMGQIEHFDIQNLYLC